MPKRLWYWLRDVQQRQRTRDDILGICGCTVWGDLARQASGTPVEQYFQDWGSRSLFTYERLNIYWCGPRYRIWFFVVDVKTMAGHLFFLFIHGSSFLLPHFRPLVKENVQASGNRH